MDRIDLLRQKHKKSLEDICKKNGVDYPTLEIFLNAEKTRKLLIKRSSMQETIDNEIGNLITES